MFELTHDLVLMLTLAAVFAGFVDAIAGGGGLITVPALALAGAPPVVTLATNKLQGSFGALTATITYARAGQVDLRTQIPMALIALAFGALGAVIAHLVPDDILRLIMPVVLIGIAVFFALRKGLSDADSAQRITPAVFAVTLVPLVSAYDGFFGPGTGSFFMLGFVLLLGYGVLKATAHTKLLNFCTNIGSLAVFALMGQVWWGVGLCMALGQIAGAALGAKLAMRVGVRLIRPLLVVTSSAMALRLLWQSLG